ncbi:MAG: DNA primase [Gammaproteobacteria bacterium]|jgi:DNA primase
MAGLIPQHFIDDLLTRVDIVDIVDSSVPLKKAGRDFKACCPFHDEKSPSFTVSQTKQFYHCFGCGAHGTALSFLMDYNGLDFIEAVEELASRVGVEVPREQGDFSKTKDNAELYELMELVVRHFCRQLRESPEAHRAVDYLKERGLSGELAKEFELGFAPPGWDILLNALGTSEAAKQRLAQIGMTLEKDNGGYYDRFRDRIIFPIRDQRGRAIGFGGRVFDDSLPKYLNSPETPIFHKGRELYGLFQARHQLKDMERIYIVEGYMDVLALAQYGIRNVVASLGTAVTENHLERLYRVCPQIIFCFDGDSAGQKAAWRAMEIALPLLKEGRQIHFMFMPEGDDPDTYVQKYGREKFENTDNYVPLSNYLIDKFKQETNLDSPEGMGQLVEGIIPLVAKLPAGAFREILIKDVAKLADMNFDSLKNLIEKKQAPVKKTQALHLVSTNQLNKEHSTLLANAISFLIQNPELGRVIEPDALSDIETQGMEFLRELLALVHQRPEISCAGILEHWRDSKYEKRLKELSIKDNLLTEPEAIKEGFLEIINKIRDDYDLQLRKKQKQNIQNIDDLRNLHPPITNTEE